MKSDSRGDADDGAISRAQGRGRGVACCSTGWATSSNCSSTTPGWRRPCLDIALTARGEHEGAPIPMCGVPIHAAEAYLARLIKAGHRVAIAEQVESPAEARKRGAKSVVNRAIVRVVTAGTLTEEALLDSRSANWLVAVARVGERCGLAAADISTGRFELGSVAPGALDAELARLDAGRADRDRATDARRRARLRQHRRRAPAQGTVRGRDARRLRPVRPRRFVRGGRAARLSRRGRARVAALPAAAGRADLGRSYDDRRGDPREPGADRLGLGHARRQPARRGRPDGDRRRRAPARRRSRRAAARPRPDRGAARPRRLVRGRCGARATGCAGSCAPCPTSAARSAGWRRGAAARATSASCATGSTRRGGCTTGSREPPSRRALLAELLPALTGHGALVDLLSRALVPSPPIDTAPGRLYRRGL